MIGADQGGIVGAPPHMDRGGGQFHHRADACGIHEHQIVRGLPGESFSADRRLRQPFHSAPAPCDTSSVYGMAVGSRIVRGTSMLARHKPYWFMPESTPIIPGQPTAA